MALKRVKTYRTLLHYQLQGNGTVYSSFLIGSLDVINIHSCISPYMEMNVGSVA